MLILATLTLHLLAHFCNTSIYWVTFRVSTGALKNARIEILCHWPNGKAVNVSCLTWRRGQI
jgi:hypothetical protein